MNRVSRRFLQLNYGLCDIFCVGFFSVLQTGGENVADEGGGGGWLQSTEYFHKNGKV